MKVSILVAFRDTSEDGWRTTLWDYIRRRLEREYGFEIVVGTDDGIDPFHKTLALNRAAAQASGDVFWIHDSDTWAPPAQIHATTAGIGWDLSRWWRPYFRKVKLKEAETRLALEDQNYVFTFERKRNHYERVTSYWAAPPLFVPRAIFEDVGGFDERHRGWGQEDEDFAKALRVLHGEPMHVSGDVFHLWHPRLGMSGRDLWPGQEEHGSNVALSRSYARARTPQQMRRVLEGMR